MSSMRIVVVGSLAQSLVNFRGPLLKALVECGHEVIACAPETRPAEERELAKIGVAYRSVPISRTGLNPLQDLSSIIALRKLFCELNPDCALFYTIKPVIYGSLAARLARVSNTYSMITGLGYVFGSGSIKQRILGTLAQFLYRLALKTNAVVFFQNPDDRKLFVDNRLISNPVRSMLINGSGVDLEHYKKVPPTTSGPVFLLIARLLWDKGIREYVEAARIIKSRYPTATFRLVGPLDSNPAAIRLRDVQAWHEEGVIEYLGRAKDVRPHIEASSVYVLPSYREGTPRTVLEAMAMGRPIITTDAPGCRETVVEGKNGYLVPVRDAGALADAMERFIVEPGLIRSMGEESWKLAVEKYDVQKVNATILSAMGLESTN